MRQIHKTMLLPAVLLLAFLTRIWNFTATSLWHDEAFSALLIQMPFSEMMHRIALDVHPPFYYWLLRIWSELFGLQLSSLRGFSVLFGVLSVWALYLFIRELTDKRSFALAAAGLLAVNPFHIQYSFEARMYTLGTFLVILSSSILLKAIRSGKWSWWISYALLTAAGALTHYFVFFSIAAQGLFVLVWIYKQKRKTRKWTWKWLTSYGLAFLLFAWWLPAFWTQFAQVQENFWIPPVSAYAVAATFWKILLGGWENAGPTIVASSSIFVAVIFFLYLWRFRGRFSRWLLAFLAGVPFVLAILLSAVTDLFLDRYFIFASSFVTAMLAMLLYQKKYHRLSVAIILLLMVVSVFQYQAAWQRLQPGAHPGMGSAAKYLAESAEPDDKVVVSSTFIYFNHRYYDGLIERSGNEPRLFLQGVERIEQLPHFSGTALLTDEDLTGPLNTFAASGDRVWLLWTTGFSSDKPDVPDNWQVMTEKRFPDVFAHRGDIFVVNYEVR